MKALGIKAVIYFFTVAALLSIFAMIAVLIAGLINSAVNAGVAAIASSFSTVWLPNNGSYGIIQMAAATLVTAVMATLIAMPLSFGMLTVIHVYDNMFSRYMRGLIRFMSGIPTVVYAFCGLFILIPLFRNMFGGSGYNITAVSFALAFLILPTMTILSDSALASLTPKGNNLAFTAASLGIPKDKTFFYIALPACRKGLVSAVLMSFSRAMGDTMIALMLSGNTPIMPEGLLSSSRTLSGHISLLAATEITPIIEFTLFLSGLLLFAAAMLLSFIARRQRQR